MGKLSNYAENKVLDHILKVAAFTQPDLYLALSTTAFDDTGGGSEVSGGAYARQLVDSWNSAASRLIDNDGAITFPEATAEWGTIGYWGIFDALSGGNLICYGAFDTAKLVNTGVTLSIADGDLDISFNAGGISDYAANAILDHIFGVSEMSVPTNLYAGLATASISDSDTGSTVTEPSGNGYARINNNSWDTASGGASANSAAMTHPTATGSWGTVGYGFIADALTSGNILFHLSLTNSRIPSTDDVCEWAIGEFAITID